MATNYATQFQEALDQPFKKNLRFAALYDYNLTSTHRFRFVRGKTVEISTLTVEGMTDVDRDEITWASRAHSNEWESYTLDHDREYHTAVDPADIDETNMVYSIANIADVFVREQLIPEMDKYMSSKLYADLDSAGVDIDTTSISSGEDALSVFDDLMEEMDEEEVPDEGRICYVTPEIHKFLKNIDNVYRRIGTTDQTSVLNRAVTRLEEVDLVKVPSARMNTSYDFTQGAVADGEQIHMIIAHPQSVIAPFKIDKALMSEPTAHSKGKWSYYQRQYWDVFVLAEKIKGIKINKDTI